MVTTMDLQVSILKLEKEGILVNRIQVLDACMEIPQLGVCNKVPQCPLQWSYCRVGIH
jgi:hypothetical protein